MPYMRLTGSFESGGETPPTPNPAAVRFAAFTPMNDQPGLADRKATFVIGAAGLLLSTTLFFVMPLQQFVRPGVWPMLILGLTFALACLLGIAMRIAYRCYTMPAPTRPQNLMFHENVAGAELSEYSDELLSRDANDVLHEVLDYNYTMAKLGAAKYRLTGQALRCLHVAIPLWMLLLLLITARGT
jgi:hypothetical protein